MTIYELIYKANENDSNVPAPTGLYSSLENAKTAGERLYKNITGQKEFYWTEEFGTYVRFDGENGATSCLDIIPVEVDSVLM